MPVTRRTRRGSQAVEFALVLPVLLALTAGIVDYGWYYSTEMVVIHGVREGARAGSGLEAGDAACTIAENATIAAIGTTLPVDASHITVTVAADGTLGGGARTITVAASLPFTELWGMVPTPDVMVGSMTMRMEDSAIATCGPS